MKTTSAAVLLMLALLQGCALQPQQEIPVGVQCPPPPPLPSVLRDRPASAQPNTSERLETLIEERDNSLTKARR